MDDWIKFQRAIGEGQIKIAWILYGKIGLKHFMDGNGAKV